MTNMRKMIEEIKKHVEIMREFCNYNEDAYLHHCPFPVCGLCEFIFKDAEPCYDFDKIPECPCHVYNSNFVKETVRKLING